MAPATSPLAANAVTERVQSIAAQMAAITMNLVFLFMKLPPFYLIYLPRYQSSYADPEMVIALAFLLPEIIPAGVQKSDAVTETM